MLNFTANGMLSINGENTQLGRDKISNLLIKALTILKTQDMPSSNFSSLSITISKREINPNEPVDEFSRMLVGNMIHMEEVTDDDFVEGYDNITWGEYISLLDDSVFCNMMRFARDKDKSKYTSAEIEQIRHEYLNKYASTKFHQVIAGINN